MVTTIFMVTVWHRLRQCKCIGCCSAAAVEVLQGSRCHSPLLDVARQTGHFAITWQSGPMGVNTERYSGIHHNGSIHVAVEATCSGWRKCGSVRRPFNVLMVAGFQVPFTPFVDEVVIRVPWILA